MPEPGDILDRTAQEIVKAAALPSRFAFGQVLDFLEGVGDCFSLLLRSLRYMFTCPITWLDSVSQMANIGVNSLVIVMLTVAFSGAVVALYSSLTLVKWGVSAYVGGGLAIAIVREIGPVLTAVVVTARSGSAMAAEIGSMKVTEQIDALRSLAISPVEYLVTPRLIACVVVMPMLTVFANFTGSVGDMLSRWQTEVASGQSPHPWNPWRSVRPPWGA